MRSLLLALVVVSAFALTDQEEWVAFKAKYNRRYATADEQTRFGIFQANLRRAEKLQEESPLATFGVTQFSDETPEEFLALHTGLNATAHSTWTRSLPRFKGGVRATDINWHTKGFNTRVINQGSCGNCWACAGTGAAEGVRFVFEGKNEALSVQYITDCVKDDGSNGCSGGNGNTALRVGVQKGIYTDASYPWTGAATACHSGVIGLQGGVYTWHAVTPGEANVFTALDHAPVAMALDASPLQSYQSGILSGSAGCAYGGRNHALVVVAIEKNVVTVKNSWGSGWGEAGYFRMAYGQNNQDGCMGYATDPSVAYK